MSNKAKPSEIYKKVLLKGRSPFLVSKRPFRSNLSKDYIALLNKLIKKFKENGR